MPDGGRRPLKMPPAVNPRYFNTSSCSARTVLRPAGDSTDFFALSAAGGSGTDAPPTT